MLHDDYKVARNNVKKLMRQTIRAYEKKIALGSKENPKAFWAHVRQKLKTKPGVAPLLANNLDLDSTKFNDKEKAEILQNQFSSVFTQEPLENVPTFQKKTDAIINTLTLDILQIKELL